MILVSKEQNYSYTSQDPLEECMINSSHNDDLKRAVLHEKNELTEIILSLSEESNVEGLSSKEVK